MDPVQAQVMEARGDGVRAEQRSTSAVYPHLQKSGSSAGCDAVDLFLYLQSTAYSEPRC